MDKYDYVVLPPEAFHITLKDRLVDARQLMTDALDVVERVKTSGQRVLVKYRSPIQLANFPCAAESRVGYGRLLDYCYDNTIVIGSPWSSAFLERLLNDAPFYSFWNYQSYQDNRFMCMEAVTRLLDVVYIAQNKDELLENILARRIFKPGRSKDDLLYSDGMYPHEIVQEIFKRQRLEKSA